MAVAKQRIIVGGLISLAATCLFAVAGRADDLLDQTRRREEIAAQKVETELRAALLTAEKLSTSDPAKAEEMLKESLAKLEDDTDLSEKRRQTLKRIFGDRIRIYRLNTEKAAKKDAEKTVKRTIADSIHDVDPKTTKRQIEDRRQVDDTARAVKSINDRRNEIKNLKKDSERRFAGAGNDVQRSALPAKDDVDFGDAKKWKEMTKRRKKSTLTAKEEEILKALASPITTDFKASKFEDVIDTLQETLGITITSDKAALDSASITYETQVDSTFKRPVAARTVLRSMLSKLGLTYVIREETLEITTPERAAALMTVRTYPIGDLVGTTDTRFGPLASELQTLQLATQIIDLIKTQIEPGTWGDKDGPSIAYEPKTMSLVIKASAEVHSMMGKGSK